MNFYEELGLSRSASLAEIRQAYRGLARLLHPDQCQDLQLRGLAEIQMKRLNQLFAVLSDPEARRRYDASLGGGAPRVRCRRIDRNMARWTALATAALALGAWVFYSPVPDVRRPANSAAPEIARGGKAATVVPAAPAEAQRQPGPAPARTRLVRQPEPEIIPDASAAPVLIEPPTVEYVHPPQSILPFPVSLPTPPAPPRCLAGNWFYVPSVSHPAGRGLYAPEYIELRIREDAGTLRGSYRARYKVTDQAISPVAAFEFESPAKLPSAHLPWAASGGANGEIALKLLSGDLLEVKWRAYRLSDDFFFTAGQATLVREQLR